MRKSLAGNGMALLLIALCGLFLFCESSWVFLTPQYSFQHVSSAALGRNGYVLAVDAGKAAVELINPRQQLEIRYQGERLFDSAELVAQDEDGTIYIADRSYEEVEAGSSQVRLLERIICLKGSRSQVIWQNASNMGTDVTRMRYPILELQVVDGMVYFLRREDYGLGLYRVAPGEEGGLIRQIYCGDVIDDASIDLENDMVVITARRGFVRWTSGGTGTWVTLYSDAAHLMPEKVSVRSGVAYFTDIYANRLCRFNPGDADSLTTVLPDRDINSIELSADGKQALLATQEGVWLLGENGSHLLEQVEVSSFPVTIMTWIALAVLVGSVLWLLRPVPKAIGRVFRKETAVRALLVVLAAVSVSAFVGYSLLNELFVKEDATLVDNMKLFSEAMKREVDTEALEKVRQEGDYGSSAYQQVCKNLNGLLDLAWSEENFYSYALYSADDGTLRYLLDSDDTVKCGQPYTGDDQDYFRQVLSAGRSFALLRQDSDGSQTSLLLPVTDDGGARRAVLEISLDMALTYRARSTTVFNMVLNVLCSTAVVIMLVMEGLFLLSFVERRRKAREQEPHGTLDGPSLVPLRTLMCLSYLADAMQDAFIAVLCTELYAGDLPLPDGVAVALPLSGQLLMMAVTSLFSGRFAERLGSRPVLALGMGVQLFGSLMCLALGSYYGLLVGKLLIGAGMGMIYVTCNTVASTGATEESVSQGFAGVSAGTLSGITIGGGLSSVFLSIGGWRMIYLIGAMALTAGLVLALSSPDVRGAKKQESEWDQALERQEISLFRFLFNRRVLGYFVLILVPFMMALSYREYFFPLYATENGMGEVRIGQIYLLCGLLVIYLGPRLSQWLLRRLGSLGAVLLSSAAMGLNMVLFVLWPGMGSVLTGVVILSVIISFAYTCQYTYFENLPDSALFGQGKAMGIYSVFESLGQTAGPIVYGAVLVLGQRQGIMVFSSAMLVLLGLFLLGMWRAREMFR